MIKRLFIKDFAIINELELPIKDGLTIITGETGAGKSIILKSLGIALGSKADKVDVRSGQDKSVIEAEVDESGNKIHEKVNQASDLYLNSQCFQDVIFTSQKT